MGHIEKDIAFGVPRLNNVAKVPNSLIFNNLIFVYDLTYLPTAVGIDRTLLNNATYYFTSTIDLDGTRLISGINTTIIGASSENCRLTSTGLGIGVALIKSNYTTAIRHITIQDVDTALDFDGIGNTMALDWTGINFERVPNIGTLKNFDNFIFTKGSFLSSQNMIFDGTSQTIAFNNSLFSGTGVAGNLIQVLPTAVISRRFRIIYSSVVAHTSTIGLNISTSATIPVEGYILDTVNFAGGSTYTTGVAYNDNKAKWINCNGITNSVTLGNMYMKNNAVITDILIINDRYQMAGVTQVNSLNQRFTHNLADNNLQYISTNSRVCSITVGLTFLAPTNNVIGFYVGINRGGAIDPTADRISESEVYVTANGSRPDNAFFQTLTTLNLNDKVYIIIQNKTSTGDITVEFANLLIQVSSQN